MDPFKGVWNSLGVMDPSLVLQTSFTSPELNVGYSSPVVSLRVPSPVLPYSRCLQVDGSPNLLGLSGTYGGDRSRFSPVSVDVRV